MTAKEIILAIEQLVDCTDPITGEDMTEGEALEEIRPLANELFAIERQR